MKLRFIFLTLLLATMARGAIPSYNGTTLVVSPTNLHRSNFLDSATLTWTKDQFGRMTPNVIGGASSNAQPPNVTLTNLSGIVTQQLAFTNVAARGKMLFVDSIHGDNATGIRGRADKPWRDIIWAKTNATDYDVVVVRPGDYTDNDLLKQVYLSYYFEPGARVRFTNNTSTSASIRMMFDDRYTGPVTNNILGYGEFYFEGRFETNTNNRGMAWLTNSSVINFSAALVEASITGGPNIAAIFYAPVTRSLSINVPIVQDPNRNTPLWSSIFDRYSEVQGVYWGLGELYWKFEECKTSWYCLWGEDALAGVEGYTNAAGLPYNAWVNGNLMQATNAAPIYMVGSRHNYKLWLNVTEINSQDDAAIMVFGSPSVYVTSQKIIGEGVGRSTIELGATGDSLIWLDAQKVSNRNGRWITIDSASSGRVVAEIDQFEDLGSMTEGIVNNGPDATLSIIGHTAVITNAIGLLHAAGTTIIDGLTLNVVGTTTNKWPVEVRASGLTLKDVVLVKSDSGTTNSIVATNAAQTVTVFGSISANTNKHPNVILTSGETVRRSGDGYWISPSATASGSGVSVSSNGVQVVATATNLNFINFGFFTNVNGNVDLVSVSGAQQAVPYILYTNGHGTNTSFWDGVKVDADGMTNSGPYRGRYVLSDLTGSGTSQGTGTNISALNTWDEADGEFTAVAVHIVDSSTVGQGAALLRLYTDPQGVHLYHWLLASNAQSAASYRLLTDGSSHQSGNANVRGTVAATNVIVTNLIRNIPITAEFDGTNVFIDGRLGNFWNLTLTNNVKLHATNIQAGATYVINMRQDGTGSRLLYVAPLNIATNAATTHVLSTAANALDVIYWTADDTGTNVSSLLNATFSK